jgi:hypothetical protein
VVCGCRAGEQQVHRVRSCGYHAPQLMPADRLGSRHPLVQHEADECMAKLAGSPILADPGSPAHGSECSVHVVSVCRHANAGREDDAVLLPSAPAVRQSCCVCFCWIRSASTATCGSCRLRLVVRLCLDPLPRYDRFICRCASSVTCSSSRTRCDSRRILVPIWSHSWSKTVPPCTPSYVLRVPSTACCPRSEARCEPFTCSVADCASRMACKRSGVRIPIAPPGGIHTSPVFMFTFASDSLVAAA